MYLVFSFRNLDPYFTLYPHGNQDGNERTQDERGARAFYAGNWSVEEHEGAGLDADRGEIVVAVVLVRDKRRSAANQLHRGACVALVVDVHTVGGAEPRDKRYLPSNLFAHIISLWCNSHGNRLRLGWYCLRKAEYPYR